MIVFVIIEMYVKLYIMELVVMDVEFFLLKDLDSNVLFVLTLIIVIIVKKMKIMNILFIKLDFLLIIKLF